MPTPENYQRAKELRIVVKQEIEDYRSGRISRFSTDRELAERFKYSSPNSLRSVMKPSGLIWERRMSRMENYHFDPSEGLAWILGILSAGGDIDRRGSIRLADRDPELLQVFRSRVERVFQVSAREKKEVLINTVLGKKYERDVVEFFNKRIANTIGNLAGRHWPTTISSRHAWILGQDKYGWSFIEGFFEKRGRIIADHDCRIMLGTTSREGGTFLAELMVRLGLKSPSPKTTRGVVLYNYDDIKLLMTNIHPVSVDKAAILDQFRQKTYIKPRYTDMQLLEDWIEARKVLGYPPTAHKLSELHKKGVVRASTNTYSYRFGNGNFARTRRILEQILEEQTYAQS